MSCWTPNEFPLSFYSFCINSVIRLNLVPAPEIDVCCPRFELSGLWLMTNWQRMQYEPITKSTAVNCNV